MSDIPDWLVELAAQGSEDDQETEQRDDDFLDFASSGPLIEIPEPRAPEAVFEETPAVLQSWEEQVLEMAAPETDAELMNVLRSQVEADELGDALVATPPRRSINLQLPGLLAWQQLVLAVLLLLDVMVVGLLFLVMLGRVSIG